MVTLKVEVIYERGTNMKKLLLINIAGFASHGKSKSDQLQTMFPDATVLNIITSGKDPDQLINEIMSSMNECPDNYPILVGSSLGGFYAYIVSSLIDCHAILINPSLKPWETLKSKIGENERYDAETTFLLTQDQLDKMEIWFNKQENVSEEQYLAVFTGTHDDVIDHAYTDDVISGPMIRCSMSWYDHQFANISIIESCIKLMHKEGMEYNGESEPFAWFD